MSVRKPIARTTTPNYVTCNIDGITFRLSYQSAYYGKLVGDDRWEFSKSTLYYMCKKLAREAIKRDLVGKIDFQFPTLNGFNVTRENGIWYQSQSSNTPAENYILPDFKTTETFLTLQP